MENHGLPVVALAVIDNGEVIQKGYGLMESESDTPQTRFYRFAEQSFTALAMPIGRTGSLMDAPVQTYIPWFKVMDLKPPKD